MDIWNFFRNGEMKRDLLCYGIVLWIGGTVLFFLSGILPCIVLCMAVLFCTGIHFHSEWKRYQRLAQMNEEIEKLLYGEHVDLLKDCREGELAILATGLNKLVRALKEQTVQSEKSRLFLAESMADISHQLKTPLTSMNLVLSFLREPALKEERRYELAGELKKLTGKIEWLVYALLRISKLDAGTVELIVKPVSVKTLLERTKEAVAIPLELREIGWHVRMESDILLLCDAGWMEEAISNLVKNCMEHTPAGGEITIQAEENALYTSIMIRDTGTGMDEEDLPHIFERFYRGKNAAKDSVGIGLALSRKIVMAQNGTLTASNRKDGSGAEFMIRMYKSVV